MWIGSAVHDGLFIPEDIINQYPAIKVIAGKFKNIQNSQYRGEWHQNLPINAGEIKDALSEIAKLIKEKHEI